MDKIFGVPLSPFVRKVLMVLEHKGIDYELEAVMPYQTGDEYAAINPLKKVPSYQDEQITLGDSSVIADYLEHKYPQQPLFPLNPVERARSLWLEEYADSGLIMHLGPGIFFERLVVPAMFRRPADEEKVQRNIDALPRHQDYLEQQLGEGEFLLGDMLSIADLIIPGLFLNASYADYQVEAARWPKLSGYLERLYAHPLYQRRMAVEAPLVEGLKKAGARQA